MSRSLLPRTSCFQSLKRSPRKSSSEKRERCSSVPIAPSSTRIRLDAASRSALSTSEPLARRGVNAVIRSVLFASQPVRRLPMVISVGSGSSLHALVTQAKQMADGIDQVGTVHGVEVELVHATVDEVNYLLGGHGGGHELAGFHIVVETVEAGRQPSGNARTGLRGEIRRLLEVLHRHDARNDRDADAAGANPVEKAEVVIVVEEELRDGAVGAAIHLGLQRIDIRIQR